MARVLVVDDTDEVLDSLGILLSKGRHTVHLAGDLESACRVLEEEPLDIVILGSLVDPKEARRLVQQLENNAANVQLVLLEPDQIDGGDLPDARQLTPPVSAEKLLALVEDVVVAGSATEQGR